MRFRMVNVPADRICIPLYPAFALFSFFVGFPTPRPANLSSMRSIMSGFRPLAICRTMRLYSAFAISLRTLSCHSSSSSSLRNSGCAIASHLSLHILLKYVPDQPCLLVSFQGLAVQPIRDLTVYVDHHRF